MTDPTPIAVYDSVSTSTLLGYVGGSGKGSETAYSPHLHLQVSTNGSVAAQSYADTLNPLRFFPNINFIGDVDYNEKNYLASSTTKIESKAESIPESYYLLDSNLIDYVGQKKFDSWLEKVNEVDCNVPGFLKYFNISDSKCTEILTTKGVSKYYGIEKVFAYRDKLAKEK